VTVSQEALASKGHWRDVKGNLELPHASQISEQVSRITERPASRSWLLLLGLVLGVALMLLASIAHLVRRGIGVWGNQQTVAWAWDIAGFVFWIGIGHAGTLISAVLFLFRQRWRTSVSRAAEAITLFSVMTAAIYPLFHMGRVWLAYWLFPVPNQMKVWPNFKSPLVWDVFAISSYFLVSVLFWYLGLVPDLATLRDRHPSPLRRRMLGFLSLGWRGSQRHYHHYEQAYLILAGLATPLVISVHTVVSFDFAVSIVPGWHSTIFPPYFVAGAVFSGSAMVVTLMIFLRKALRLENLITVNHLEAMNKVVLATGTMLAYSYAVEFFLALQGNDPYEKTTILGRMTGPYAWACWLMLGCNVVLPQLYWLRRMRTSIVGMLVISLLINVGMWLERFVIIVTAQHRSFLPATWFDFHPTWVDASTLFGTFGLFLTLFVLFVRFVPVISMSEVKSQLVDADNAKPTNVHGTHLSLPRESTRARISDDEHRNRYLHIQQPSEAVQPTILLGVFDDADSAAHAGHVLAQQTNEEVDIHAPYPMRGAARALGLGRSPLPWIVLASGVFGGTLAFIGQWWMEAIDYPTRIGGKSAGAWQAYVPVTFEVTILCAAVGCFIGLWFLCRLPHSRHPLVHCDDFRRSSDDRFYVSVETEQSGHAELASSLRNSGALEVTEVPV
jgi:molybdopterin-containing oxidoreductase family membrane subunit